MSQQACRWKWCRQTYPTVVELLSHVSQEHVRNTEFCSLRDIPMHMRAEEGTGDSMSGMTVNAASYVLSGTQDHGGFLYLRPASFAYLP
ncbi:hypothetical protein B0H11DRAFT_1719536 [Mycena galericulata]|nr:hypothetical protein B0H11DRAFT_1719536 [Mycena galericulata]